MDNIKEYEKYSKKIGDRFSLYQVISKKYSIKSALYPGSYIDIAPSLVIEEVIYVDNFKGASKFFGNMDAIEGYIETNKRYEGRTKLKYIDCDYSQLKIDVKVDLIISQYAGFVGQKTKKFLSEGGILLCNDSHGDATLAKFDNDFEFIGIVNLENKIVTDSLDGFFKFARSRNVDIDKVKKTMKGPNYKIKANNYIFRKKNI